MTKRYFEEMMNDLGFHTVDTVAVGFYKTWPCSVEWTDGQISLRVPMLQAGKPCVKELKAKKLQYIQWYIEQDVEQTKAAVLIADVTPPSDFYSKSTLLTAMQEAVKCLEKAGQIPTKTCLLCGGENCDGGAYVKEECRPVHYRCLVDEILKLQKTDTHIPAKVKGMVWSGFLGALLGAAIAALPNWAQALSDGTVNQILYMFLPFMASLLYRLFRGKAHLLVAGITVIVASMLVAFGLELIWFWVVATAQAGYNITLMETTTVYFELYSARTIFLDMAPSLLFLMLGFFPSSILLRRYVYANTVTEKLERGGMFVKKSAFHLLDEKAVPYNEEAEIT